MNALPPDPFWLLVGVVVVAFFLIPLALFLDDLRRERGRSDERNY